jgi:hypothetical protein
MVDQLNVEAAVIAASTFQVFGEANKEEISIVESVEDLPKGKLFDIIFGDFPLGMSQVPVDNKSKTRLQKNWIYILEALPSLSETGTGFFLAEPHGFSTHQGKKFLKQVESDGYSITAFFNTPKKLLQPETSIIPIIVGITKREVGSVFIGELLDLEQTENVVSNFVKSIDTGSIGYGTFIDNDAFTGFDQQKSLQQIGRLETQYKEFSKHSIKDLSESINLAKNKENYEEKSNAVYIPKIGNSPVVCKLDDAKLKHHNYFQVVLNNNAINEYVALFFVSAIGKLILKSLSTQSFIPHLNKRDLENVVIALPNINEQRDIISTHNKLNELKSAIEMLGHEISLNPTGSKLIEKQLDSMLESIGLLSDADRVRNIVREGESRTVEFKETLSLCLNKQSKEKYIETSVLKTIVAFLNTAGGTLIVGVSDDCQIPGVDDEIDKFHKKNPDNFLKHTKNLIKVRIGEEFYPYFSYHLVEVDGNQILVFECKPSSTPCYLDTKEFYVRTNPATDKLEGPKLVQYVQNHF